ncbi:molybdate ABC transporter permease subunit [Pseudoalteromonas sp. OOF1S-7]|uniref:molybdate ABC transporter permease subunit n=1 Tax=Pseudoalteromonas sp. OOF1S-7 TaxID=2917757 RepID=UPI001EF6B70E|nr:molybdate ABC transporter permease subunit [Pseudoalteromonas sp. OOF1S-7]MCG7533467.1 molybdate ABC transporter permease subunit [Pseudoalteromonas sp. OOF1S-7]
MSDTDLQATILTLQLASVTTLCLLLICVPGAYYLARSRSVVKPFIETLVTLPLVLPPTVMGYYFLVLFSPNDGLGLWLRDTLGIELVFSFSGIWLASMIYSLPFTFRPLQSAFEQLPKDLYNAAALLGFSPWQQFRQVILPAIKPALYTAATLSFAHTIGEFGAILMIGGNIVGETQVLSLALFDHAESLDFQAAEQLALLMLAFSFSVVFACQWWQKQSAYVGYTSRCQVRG